MAVWGPQLHRKSASATSSPHSLPSPHNPQRLASQLSGTSGRALHTHTSLPKISSGLMSPGSGDREGSDAGGSGDSALGFGYDGGAPAAQQLHSTADSQSQSDSPPATPAPTTPTAAAEAPSLDAAAGPRSTMAPFSDGAADSMPVDGVADGLPKDGSPKGFEIVSPGNIGSATGMGSIGVSTTAKTHT